MYKWNKYVFQNWNIAWTSIRKIVVDLLEKKRLPVRNLTEKNWDEKIIIPTIQSGDFPDL